MTEKSGRSPYIRQRGLTEGGAGGVRVSKIVPAGRRLLGAFQGQGEVIREVRGLVGPDLRGRRPVSRQTETSYERQRANEKLDEIIHCREHNRRQDTAD